MKIAEPSAVELKRGLVGFGRVWFPFWGEVIDKCQCCLMGLRFGGEGF